MTWTEKQAKLIEGLVCKFCYAMNRPGLAADMQPIRVDEHGIADCSQCGTSGKVHQFFLKESP